MFYDETNNERKLTLEPDKEDLVNSKTALFNDFILGGIALPPGSSIDVNELKHELGLPADIEMKSKSLFTSKNFEYDIGRKRMHIFLDWMLNNPLYVHFFISSNIYDSIIEIVDECLMHHDHENYLRIHMEMKDCLYHYAMNNLNEYLNILIQYDYPEIDESNEHLFCMKMAHFVEKGCNDKTKSGFLLNIFKQNMESVASMEKLGFMNLNKKGAIIGDYSSYYWHSMRNTPCAMHYFDHEMTIEKKFETMDIRANGERYDFFEFKDSKDCPEIQVADLFVGTIGRLFRWIDSMDRIQLQKTIIEMKVEQLESLFKINGLIKRAENVTPYLVCRMTAPSIMDRRFSALNFASLCYISKMMTSEQ